jgi:hypothetical protein
MSLESIRSRVEFMSTITDFANFSRVGISYYDSSIRQLHVLEVWEDGSREFPLIDLGISFKSHFFFFLGMGFCFF